jgi:ribose 5-phosphate isomerase B
MITQLGTHEGKKVIFGFDHYMLPEVDAYTAALSRWGVVYSASHTENPHYLSSTGNVCELVRGHHDMVGVLVCSTGMGISIAANKFSGIYAARCLSTEDAQLSRHINNSNVLCLALRSGFELNKQIIETFMTTPYEGRKLEQLSRITMFERELEPAPAAVAMPARARFKSV